MEQEGSYGVREVVEPSSRFEELDDDESEPEGQPLSKTLSSALVAGMELALKPRPREPDSYDDLAYGEDYGGRHHRHERSLEEEEEAREDELIDHALHRIERAKRRHDPNVDLDEEELAALERRGLLPATGSTARAPADRRNRASSAASTSSNPRHRHNAGSSTAMPAPETHARSRRAAPGGTPLPRASRSRTRYDSRTSSPGASHHSRADIPQPGYAVASVAPVRQGFTVTPPESPHRHRSRSRPRGILAAPDQSLVSYGPASDARYPQQVVGPPLQPEYPHYPRPHHSGHSSSHRPPSRSSDYSSFPDESSYGASASGRGSRSGSSAGTFNVPPPVADPFAYPPVLPAAGRNMPPPPTVSYSSLRRNVVPSAEPSQSQPDVIEISSDEDERPRGGKGGGVSLMPGVGIVPAQSVSGAGASGGRATSGSSGGSGARSRKTRK